MPENNAALNTTRSSSLTTFSIKVDGEALPGTYRVMHIDINRAFNRIATASIKLLDGDAASQSFDISSSEKLIPGITLEAFGGYNTTETLLFKGVIIKQNIELRSGRDSFLSIECKDLSFQMALVPSSQYYAELSDSDLFEELVAKYDDLAIEVDALNTVHPEIVQYQISDWDLMISRAEKCGLYCVTENSVVKLFKPDTSQEAVAVMSYGRNIFEFDLVLDASTQYEEVSAASWDSSGQELLTADISDVETPEQGSLQINELAAVGGSKIIELKHSGRLSQEEMDGWVESKMQKVRFSKIRGTIKTQGTELIKPGDIIQLEGLGERFNGLAIVSGTRQFLGKGDWFTTLQIGEDPRWHQEKFEIGSVSSSVFHAPIKGLQVGVVTQLENDPDSEDRILVRLPIISGDNEGIWSRLATLDAGDNRGTVIRPEIGDEVVVGFIDEDPEQAIVLAMLHSSVHPAPIPGSDDNHEKAWVTRSGMKLLFNDDDPSVRIETPQGNKIVFSDKDASIVVTDEHNNSITLDAEGITLDSAKNITLKAQQDINLEAKNISAKSSMALKMEGGSGAELKSGGTTNVKGSLVNIN